MRLFTIVLALSFGLSALGAQQGTDMPPQGAAPAATANEQQRSHSNAAQIVPPAGAQDLDNAAMPAATTGTGMAPESSETTSAYQPSAPIAPPADVVRVYIANLSGADTQAIAGLLTQALFESKKVIITENQSNASLVLSGQVWREPVRTSKAASPVRERRRSTSTRLRSTPAAGPSGVPSGDGFNPPATAVQLPGNSASVANASGYGTAAGYGDSSALTSNPLDGLTLPPLGGAGATLVDLNAYRYRLDLQLVTPQGDLVWISGRGDQALPFAGASQAVARTVQPMLAAILALTPGHADSH